MISNGGSATSSGLNIGNNDGPSRGQCAARVGHRLGVDNFTWRHHAAGSGTLNSGNGIIVDNGGLVLAGSVTLDTNLGGSNDFVSINGGTLSNGTLTVGISANSESNILSSSITAPSGSPYRAPPSAESTPPSMRLIPERQSPSGTSITIRFTINAGSVSNTIAIGAGSFLTNVTAIIAIGGAASVGNQFDRRRHPCPAATSRLAMCCGLPMAICYQIAGGATPATRFQRPDHHLAALAVATMP